MTKKANAFLLYKSFRKPVKNLSDTDAGQLIKALFDYTSGEVVGDLSVAAQTAFDFIREWIDASDDAYEEKCAANRANGALGGRPKKRMVLDETEHNRTVTDETEPNRTKPNESEKTLYKYKYKNKNDIDTNVSINKKEIDKEKSDLDIALDEYTAMRKKIKKPISSEGLNRLKIKLSRLASNDEEKIELLQYATDHCWQSVYPIDEQPRSQRGKPESSIGRIQRMINEEEGQHDKG